MPSSAAAAAASFAHIRIGAHLRWRAAFAVQVYSALELPTFRSLEPWLFRTPLRTLQPLATRFWREDRLDLLEGVLRIVEAEAATTGRVVAALAGWQSHSLDTDINQVQVQNTIGEFRNRLKDAPQLQQAYRQKRKQQRQLTHGVTDCASSPGSASAAAATSTIVNEQPVVSATSPLLDLFFLSLMNSATVSPTCKLMIAPPPPLWATTSTPASAEDAETSPSNRAGDSNLAPTSLESQSVELSEHDAAALVALSASGSDISADKSGSRASIIPILSPQRTSPRQPLPAADSAEQAEASHRGASASSCTSARPTSAKKKGKQKRKRKRTVAPHAAAAAEAEVEESEVTSSDEQGTSDDEEMEEVNEEKGDERWTVSCADGFQQLLGRYPLLLKHAPRRDGPAVEMHFRASYETALSCAVVIHGLPAPSPSSIAATRHELAAALDNPRVRKTVVLRLQPSKDGSVHIKVRDSSGDCAVQSHYLFLAHTDFWAHVLLLLSHCADGIRQCG